MGGHLSRFGRVLFPTKSKSLVPRGKGGREKVGRKEEKEER